MTSEQISDFVIRNQVYLEGLKNLKAREFVAAYDRLEAEILRGLAALGKDNMSEVSRTQFETLIRKLKAASIEAGAKAIDELSKDLVEYSDIAAGIEASALGKAVTSKVKRVSAADVMKRVLEQPIPLGNDQSALLGNMFSNLKANEAERLGNAVRMSWLQGDTLQQATRRIVGSAASNYSDGVMAVTRRNASAVVHTSLQHLSSQARFATYEENDDFVIGYRIVATLDVSTTAVCRSMDGLLFLNKDAGPKPKPPFHVNCRTTTEPELDEDFDFLDEGATRSSREGYVDSKTRYHDWLKNQSAAEQDKILGKERAKLFREGGLTPEQFAALQLDRNFQPRTLAEMKALAPEAFEKSGAKTARTARTTPGTTTPAQVKKSLDKAETQAGFDFPVRYGSQYVDSPGDSASAASQFIKQLGLDSEDDIQDGTLNQYELFQALTGNQEKYVFKNDNDEIVSAVSFRFQRSKIPNAGPDVYVDNVGSIAPKGGTFAMKSILEEAAKSGGGVRLLSLEEAEDFYLRWGFAQDAEEIRGNFYLPPDKVKETLERMTAYLGL